MLCAHPPPPINPDGALHMLALSPRQTHASLAVHCAANVVLLAIAFAALVIVSSRAEAMKIQEVKSPGGVTAWLVEEHGIPLIAMRFAFEGGNAQDPDGKEGVANYIASMMEDRKSTRLNSSHLGISYAVFCLKKK